MEERNLRKEMIGTVVSDKMDKTVVVAVQTNVMNKMYGKIQKRTYKLKAHDENNQCQAGDKVRVMENITSPDFVRKMAEEEVTKVEKKIMDDISYEYKDGRNILILEKNI